MKKLNKLNVFTKDIELWKARCYNVRKRRSMIISNFICPECNTVVPLPRNHGQRREVNHIKDLYCPGCKATRKFVEVGYKKAYKTLDGVILYG